MHFTVTRVGEEALLGLVRLSEPRVDAVLFMECLQQGIFGVRASALVADTGEAHVGGEAQIGPQPPVDK